MKATRKEYLKMWESRKQAAEECIVKAEAYLKGLKELTKQK
jgi:hypothetical protein